MSRAEVVFAELASATPTAKGRAYRSFGCAEGLHIRAFFDGVARLPGISLRTRKRLIPAEFILLKLRGVAATVTSDGGSGRDGEVTYELTAATASFADVFMALASRLIDDAASKITVSEALMCVAGRIATWVRFFDARGDGGMPRWAELGLIGELLCLAELADIAGLRSAVGGWVGPSGAPHDFRVGMGAVEAKLTTSSAPERLRISSERQLDDSVVPVLCLFAVVAQEVAMGLTTLVGLVDALRLRIDAEAPSARVEFEEKLLASGFCDSDRRLYAISLTVHHADFLKVRGDFPRIRAGELREGVFAVRYDIPWSAVAPYRITRDEAKRALSV